MIETDAQIFARHLANLFKEYAEKLTQHLTAIDAARERVKESGRPWWGSREFMAYSNRISPMQAALQTATREASQLAEQGAVDDFGRIELRVRLAEVEGLSDAVQSALNHPE